VSTRVPCRRVFVGVLALAATASLLGVPATASSKPLQLNGDVGLVNLHLKIPYFHVRMLVPQLRSDDPSAIRANETLRRGAAKLAGQWVSYLSERVPRGRGGPGRPPGVFDVLPRPGLTGASPLIVDSLLPVLGICSGCTDVQYWSSDDALLASGDSVSLYHVLFDHQRTALQAIARQIRLLYRRAYPAPNACVAQSRAHHLAAPSIAELVHGIALWHDLALEANGLEVGFNQGYLYNDACGLPSFLIPYSTVLPHSSALGRRLIESFAEEPTAWDRTGLPPRAFPRSIAEALALVARRAHFPAEGPTQPLIGPTLSIGASATANSYFVDYFPCSPAVPMNSPKLDACITANFDILGGFGAMAYVSHAKALRALLACSAWTCESRVTVCPERSRHSTIDGQRVAICSYGRGPIDEVSWHKGTWTFIVGPTVPGEWRAQTYEIVAEERSVDLPRYPGVLQNDPGGDNNNTIIEWTVGKDDYFVDPYFGGQLANAVSFRAFKQ